MDPACVYTIWSMPGEKNSGLPYIHIVPVVPAGRLDGQIYWY